MMDVMSHAICVVSTNSTRIIPSWCDATSTVVTGNGKCSTSTSGMLSAAGTVIAVAVVEALNVLVQ